ncbi:hypothetical protein Fmac_008680 [Flemingia macrophylla]|uniref:Secreted protein n=1 Tax=Flemingia macrophylla TaxID=520843 RepID=A0ABD1MY22_9FABA
MFFSPLGASFLLSIFGEQRQRSISDAPLLFSVSVSNAASALCLCEQRYRFVSRAALALVSASNAASAL